MTIRVVIADDQGMVRSGFSVLLNAQPDIEVIAEAVNGQEAVKHAADLHPDVILMDVRMPVLDGLQATRAITAMAEPPKVLVLTTFDLDDYVYEALRSGASGFLLKDASARELADAVRLVAAGDALLAPGVTRRLIAEFARMGAPRTPGRKQLARRRGADREDPREPHPDEARAAGPHAGGRPRLRERPRAARRLTGT